MLQRQKGPQWWYDLKKVARDMIEKKNKNLRFLFILLAVGINFLFSFASGHFSGPYTSPETVLGIPLFTTESFRFAILSVSGIPCGLISIGGISFGLLSLGGLALGWLAVGGGAAGYLALGGGTLGYYCIGGLALGGYAYAGRGVAIGLYEAEGRQKEKLIGMKPHQEAIYRRTPPPDLTPEVRATTPDDKKRSKESRGRP